MDEFIDQSKWPVTRSGRCKANANTCSCSGNQSELVNINARNTFSPEDLPYVPSAANQSTERLATLGPIWASENRFTETPQEDPRRWQHHMISRKKGTHSESECNSCPVEPPGSKWLCTCQTELEADECRVYARGSFVQQFSDTGVVSQWWPHIWSHICCKVLKKKQQKDFFCLQKQEDWN